MYIVIDCYCYRAVLRHPDACGKVVVQKQLLKQILKIIAIVTKILLLIIIITVIIILIMIIIIIITIIMIIIIPSSDN